MLSQTLKLIKELERKQNNDIIPNTKLFNFVAEAKNQWYSEHYNNSPFLLNCACAKEIKNNCCIINK